MSGLPGAEDGSAALPTLAALRAARASRIAAIQRRWRPALAVGGFFLAVSLSRSHLRFGAHGSSFVAGMATVVFLASLAIAVGLVSGALPQVSGRVSLPHARRLALTLTLPLLVASSVTLEWLQSGAGTIGLYAAVAVGGRVYPRRVSAVMYGTCLAYFVAVSVLVEVIWNGDRNGLPGLPDMIAITAIYLMSLFIGQMRAQELLEERLLGELEDSRTAELRAVALAERQRLAREMHDVLAHSLSGLVLQLEGARMLAVTAPDDRRLPELIDGAHQLAKSGLEEARQAIGMLRDDDLPGPEQLAGLAAAFTADTGIPCGFSQDGTGRELTSGVRLTLYRVTQEALTNIRKHARPDAVSVRLAYLADMVTLTVEDTAGEPALPDTGRPGAGPQAGTAPGGYGLTGMRERAELLGGTVTAGPTDAGFRVRLEVPA